MEDAMIKDGPVKELWRLLGLGRSLAAAARMTEMNEKTARKYRDDERLPSERKTARNYRTRVDPFADVWAEVQQKLAGEPALKAKTLFDWLQQTGPGRFPDSTRRTFERRVAEWRSLHGPGKTVFFTQVHHPGRLAASDFTVCNGLGVKIAGERFDHTWFHCVLTYSNVEAVSLCFSESFEALSQGIQKAFWEFGGVPGRHRTDSLSAAVRNHSNRKTLTDRYAALMDHYRCEAERTNARCANENGDVESSHGHLKDRIDQALLLRGSRDFASRDEYVRFVEELIARANANRSERFLEEQACFQPLPRERLDTDERLHAVRVSRSSTIQVRTNTYSVPSRLIGQQVDVRVGAEQITVTHQGHLVQTMPRLVGKKQVSINYRHIIDSLVRKPGAFANYQYREEMFPTSTFRIAYDMLRDHHAEKAADKMYVQILELAARESQGDVAEALRHLIAAGEVIDVARIAALVAEAGRLPPVTDLEIETPDLSVFDALFTTFDKESPNHAPHESLDANFPESDTRFPSEAPVPTGESRDVEHEAGENAASENRSDDPVDRAIPGTASAGDARPFPGVGTTGGGRESQSSGVSVGTDDAGMRSPAGGTHPAAGESFAASAGQNMGCVPVRPSAAARNSPAADAAQRLLPETPRERPVVRETRFGEEPCVMRPGRTIDLPGTQPAVYDMQPAGAAVVAGKAGSATAQNAQAIVGLRGFDHRRPGVRSADSGGDGSAVHPAGGTVRTRQRAADEQSGLQQVGPDLQGRDDDGRRHRPPRAPQCDHRTERPQLPRGNGQTDQITRPTTGERIEHHGIPHRNSNCR
jgi:Mu transposase, C-terminal domain